MRLPSELICAIAVVSAPSAAVSLRSTSRTHYRSISYRDIARALWREYGENVLNLKQSLPHDEAAFDQVVQSLLAFGAPIRFRALTHAAYHGHIRTLTVLLAKASSQLEELDFDRCKIALPAFAIAGGQIAALRFLLRHELWDDPDWAQARFTTPHHLALEWAAGRGDEGMVAMILDEGRWDRGSEFEFECEAFDEAAAEGHVSVMKLLLERGVMRPCACEGNRCACGWQNALDVAVHRGQHEVVGYLVEQGVKPSDCFYLLWHACVKNDDQMLDLLLRISDPHLIRSQQAVRTDPLRYAIFKRRPNVVHKLLTHGADPNLPKNKPLILAARTGQREIFDMLVEHGADTVQYEELERSGIAAAALWEVDCGAAEEKRAMSSLDYCIEQCSRLYF
ncbi:hypothetical protein HK104_004084 [Borealophlyctis nickersoniae]|nr:hypothetical protein HK104_004084 [Borealophlyctis nickersoniae]